MTNPLKDVLKSGVILITGTNTTANHPIIANYIHEAVTKNGAKLIVVDPRRIKLVDLSSVWLRPRVGANVAWINGMMNVIISENLQAQAYIDERTTGFAELRDLVARYTPERVQELTGIPVEDLKVAARLFATAGPGAILYAMGITQHTTGTNNVKCLAALSMLCGYVGVDGGGVNPLRGQNNVQGACDMGGLPNVFPGYQAVTDDAVREKFAKAWKVSKLDGKVGLTVTEMTARAGDSVKALYIMGENPILSDADVHHVEKNLKALEFLVVQDIFMTETAKLADVVLPSGCFAEKEGTFSNTERKVLRVRKAVNAPGEAWEDHRIIAGIAEKMGFEIGHADASAIMDEIGSVTPSYGGISYDRLEKGGLTWPCPTPEHPGTPVLHINKFSRGEGVFFPIEYQLSAELPDAEYPFVLTTGRVYEHYHTGTMTRKGTALNRLYPEALAEINVEDARTLKVVNGDYINIISRRGRLRIKAMVSEVTDRGVTFVPFHFFEAAVNQLTNSALDPVSKIPELKICAVKIEKAA
jgi:predicted molibdopterin-dependent oxidoreductase YjgC